MFSTTFSHSLRTVTTHQEFRSTPDMSHTRASTKTHTHKENPSRFAPDFTPRLKSDAADYDILRIFSGRYLGVPQPGVEYQVPPAVHLLDPAIECTRLRISWAVWRGRSGSFTHIKKEKNIRDVMPVTYVIVRAVWEVLQVLEKISTRLKLFH